MGNQDKNKDNSVQKDISNFGEICKQPLPDSELLDIHYMISDDQDFN